MEWVIVERTWVDARSRIKQQWTTLTDDDLDEVAGRRSALHTKLQKHLSLSPDEADRQLTDWESRNHDLFAETAEQIKPYLGIAKQ